jgi:hypothetical protein
MVVNCPSCSQENDFPESLAGSEARCSACGALISVPVTAEAPDPAAAEAEPGEAPAEGGGDGRGSVFARLDGAQVTDSDVLDPAKLRVAAPRPLWVKLVLVGLPLLILLGVAGTFAGMMLERQSYARRVDGRFKQAEAAYLRGEFENCEKILDEGLKLLAARPEAVPAGADALKQRAKVIRSHIGKWREARSVMTRVSIQPAETRRKLEDLLKVVMALGADAEPVAEKVREMGQKAYDQDLADRRKDLETYLSSIQSQMDDANFEGVRDALKLARERIAKARGQMGLNLSKAFEPRLKELEAAVRSYDEVKKFVAAAPKGGPKRAAARAELLKRRAALVSGGVAAKGFTKQFDKWTREMSADRRDLPAPLRLTGFVLTQIAKDFAAGVPGSKFDEKTLDEKRALFRLSTKDHQYRIMVYRLGREARFMVEIDGVRLSYPVPGNNRVRRALIRYEMAQAPLLVRTLKESGGEAAWSADPWFVYLLGPLQGAEPTAVLRGKGLVCTAGRVWKVEARSTEKAVEEAGRDFIGAARELEEAIKNDKVAGAELRSMLNLMVRAAYQPRKSASDFLPRQFCSEAVARGYVGRNAPQLAARLKDKLSSYKRAYRNLVRFVPGLVGKGADGSEISWGLNADGRTLWRVYDSKAGTTTFALAHNDAQWQTRFFVHTVFGGKHSSWPATEMPRAVRMVHQAVGQVASWDPAGDKLVCDRARWKLATELEQFRKPPAHFGSPNWRFPPHVLLTDSMGSALGLVTFNGRLDMPEFGKRSGAARRKAQDAFIDKCAKTLRTAGELHLFFRYFVKYTYDSPLTDYPFLIGDKTNTGDVHQDAYQTLDRKVGGRFIADCDDLAEFYQQVTRRQGRLSFVLGRPSHAICGFVERNKGGDYLFTAVDTGPPRQFRAKGLDEVIETGFATFDEEQTEAFDPNSVCFLLRFAGEQTRTPYFLGTRMFVDAKYARTMIRVQRDWHFAYIASGKETMVEMVKRETDSPTLFELAAFYRELGEWPLAIKWAKKGIAALPAADLMGRLTENRRLASYMERSGDKKGAADLLIATARGVAKAEAAAAANARRFVGLRLNAASDLDALERPWDAWDVAAPAARSLARAGKLGGDNVTRLAVILLSMRDEERAGGKLTAKQKAAAEELDGLLAGHLTARHFKERDTFRAHMDKYADLAIFYAARKGRDYALKQLLAPGPYPTEKRTHHRRGGDAASREAEDWKWIRVSVHAYNYFFHEALDGRKPVDQRRPQEAVKILTALEKAIPEIRKHGALGGMEFAILGMSVRRDAITKNWAGMERTFKLMKKKNWGRLYRLVALSLGDAASYTTPAEFEQQFRKFCDQRPPLPHYFRVAYEALGDKRYEAALIAARISAERFPDNPEVQREYKLLRALIEKRRGAAGRAPGEKAKPAPGAAAG